MPGISRYLPALACITPVISQTLQPRAFNPLPLGKIKPAGWLQNQINLQVNGLAGNEHEFYTWISESDWWGGNQAYSDLEEAAPYWLNGLVPTAFISGSASLINATQTMVDYVFQRQEVNGPYGSGWFGPEVTTLKPRYLWGRYYFLLGAAQLAEADATRTNKIVTAMYAFVNVAYNMLQAGEGLDDGGWGNARWHEFALSLQWLLDNHPNGNEQLLFEVMGLLRSKGTDWNSVFSPGNFPTGSVTPGSSLNWHGVNVAEGLHMAAVAYRFSGLASDLAAIAPSWAIAMQYHGRPSGVIAADEYLAGLEAVRGSELCMVVEMLFSASVVTQVTGNTTYADHAEKIAFNALPATVTSHMWSHQYLQQQNQVAAMSMSPNPFPGDGPYSNVFGLEPNYPCCTVNHPQGFAKFVTNAFLTTPNGASLVHMYLGPFSVSTTLGNNNQVSVSVSTQYPFSDVITTSITASSAFTYYVRIPEWTQGGTLSFNGGTATPVKPSNGLQAVSIAAGTSSFVLNLPAEITVESRPHGSIAVHRGPLHYALQIAHVDTTLQANPARFSQPQPNAVDSQMNANSAWQYAIDPKTLNFHSGGANPSLPNPVFVDSAPPVYITASACPIAWATGGATFAASPPQSPSCAGATTTVTLYPYGATRLRIGEIPTVSL